MRPVTEKISKTHFREAPPLSPAVEVIVAEEEVAVVWLIVMRIPPAVVEDH